MKYSVILLGLISLLVVGCADSSPYTSVTEEYSASLIPENRSIVVDKLEIIHFHGTNQCYSCIAVGDYAEETVNTYFKEELENGIIVFEHINGELAQNKELVLKYGATGSSLWLGTYESADFTAEQNIQVWYKIRNKNQYMNYLKEEIEKKLSGY